MATIIGPLRWFMSATNRSVYFLRGVNLAGIESDARYDVPSLNGKSGKKWRLKSVFRALQFAAKRSVL